MKKIIIFSLLFVLAFTSTRAEAQSYDSNSGLNVFPAIIETALDAGSQKSATFKITNNTKEPLALRLTSTNNYDISEVIDINKQKNYDASKWLDFKSSIALEPSQSTNVAVTIKAPSSAAPGGKYAEILIKELALEDSSSQTNIIKGVTIPVLVTVNGDARSELLIEEADYFPTIKNIFESLETPVTLANTGDTHLLPTIKIQSNKKSSADLYSFSPGILIPNTKKTVNLKWGANLSLGVYKPQITVTYQNSKIASTKPENMLVFLSPAVIFTGLFFGFIMFYLYLKRGNLKQAYRVLVNKNKV